MLFKQDTNSRLVIGIALVRNKEQRISLEDLMDKIGKNPNPKRESNNRIKSNFFRYSGRKQRAMTTVEKRKRAKHRMKLVGLAIGVGMIAAGSIIYHKSDIEINLKSPIEYLQETVLLDLCIDYFCQCPSTAQYQISSPQNIFSDYAR